MRLRGNCIRPEAARTFTRPFARGFSADAGSSAPAEAQRQFPDSAAAWASVFPTLPTPLAIWTFQESASPIDDKVGTKDLVENSALLYAQTGDTEPTLTPRLAMQIDTDNASTEWTGVSSDTTFGNISIGGHGFLLARVRVPATAANRGIAGKGGDTTTQRWGLRVESTGALTALCGDGVTTTTLSSTGIHDDNAYIDVIAGVDSTADVLRLITPTEDLNGALDAGIVTLINTAGLSPTTSFRCGAVLSHNSLAGMQFSYLALFNQVLTQAHLTTFRTAQ